MSMQLIRTLNAINFTTRSQVRVNFEVMFTLLLKTQTVFKIFATAYKFYTVCRHSMLATFDQ